MSTDNHADYLKLYDMESYLFETVNERFHREGNLSAFDFFCIVIWKANRAKSRIAQWLLNHKEGGADLEAAVRKLTGQIAEQASPKERLRVLIDEWGFLLPMASAILTVCYPDDFTVYDYRVRDELECRDLSNLTFKSLWPEYEEFRLKVTEITPADLSLRDKDRFLSGKSFHEQLTSDIANAFGGPMSKGKDLGNFGG